VQALYRDLATIVDAATLKIPPVQENNKKSIARVRNTLSEAAGMKNLSSLPLMSIQD
jgi:hypothetical protein